LDRSLAMASPKTKSPSIKKKSYRLTNSDLALAATAPADRRKSLIKAAAGGSGYDYYKGIKTNLDSILYHALSSGASSHTVARKQLKAAVADACIGSSEIKNNQSIAEGLYSYVVEHQITAAAFDFPSVTLGRAGPRSFWAPYLLKIDGRKYIPFLDFRQGPRRLTREARRFIFSIQHTHIRLANPTEYRDVGFVILEFAAPQSKVRTVVPHFDAKISFWSDPEIGAMIDAVYRTVDEVKKAA
jgi:hypothetical protein